LSLFFPRLSSVLTGNVGPRPLLLVPRAFAETGDGRKLAGYANGLHHELETHWSKQVDSLFDDAQLEATSQSPPEILAAARAVDSQFGIQFEPTVPKIKSGWDPRISGGDPMRMWINRSLLFIFRLLNYLSAVSFMGSLSNGPTVKTRAY